MLPIAELIQDKRFTRHIKTGLVFRFTAMATTNTCRTSFVIAAVILLSLTIAGCRSRSDGPSSDLEKNNKAADATKPTKSGLSFETSSSDELTYAPDQLKTILKSIKSPIDLRYVAKDKMPYDGVHWRMKTSDKLQNAHVDQFKLESTSDRNRTSKMLLEFPKDWPDISKRELQWYAWPHNRDDGMNLQLWFVMAIDRKTSTLYFFYQNYDVTP